MDKPSSVVQHEEVLQPTHGKSMADVQGAIADNETEHRLTLGDIWKNHRSLIWCSFFWAMCAIGWGFDAQINGAMISVPAFRRDFGYIFNGEPVLPANWQTAFNVVSSVGQFFGGFMCGWTADKFGRKGALAAGLVLCSGGIFGEIFSTTRVAFLVSKLILGFGLGYYLTIGPMACSEIAPVALRGISTAGINLGIALGQLLSNAVVKGFGEWTTRWAYAAPFAIQMFFVAFLSAGFYFVPESPWYLVRQGRDEQALKSLQTLWGNGIDVNEKLASLKLTIQEEQALKESSFLDCFKGVNLRRSLISTGAFACQHFVGIIFVLGYSTYFFQLAGLATSRSFDLGVGVTACALAGNIASWFIVDSFGRRKIFVSGMAALTLLLLLIGIMDFVPSSGAKWVQSSCTVIYAFVYSMSLGAMAFVLLGEVSSMGLRAHTTALATATQSSLGVIFNIVIPYLMNPDEADLRGKVGFVFGGLAAIATVGAWVYIPELKGRTTIEIDLMFSRQVPSRKMGTYDIDAEGGI
ncbi:hypothetical protein HBI75_079330 [Parastagonospora nodorum]|nr:hypothetical protein HBI75_079330 [Parastagonospora nodorum]KAH5056253.1 hypothetical protein HBH96_119800 [Parastagonospora nodorum]KAH5078513.1 hypothetical protein HBH95_098020 [Parastagonospora nodorum]KAH5677038.1 hypothetical protein HBI21_101440 [Parastagonospora nodorum]KAH5693952.1 hypothetical protein HBI44_141480 [Parastagonospora nodorum]